MAVTLLPLVFFAVYLYGWRALLVTLVVNIAGFLSEYFFNKVYKKPVSTAVFVTGLLFSLSLPPSVPISVAVIGIVFGVLFGKMVFGGFGRNIFNPAITGRAFVYLCFGVPLTAHFSPPLTVFPAGLTTWLSNSDALTIATPLFQFDKGNPVALRRLFFGLHAGSMGEVSALLILLCGAFLLFKKIANWRIVAASVAGYLIAQTLFYYLIAASAAQPPVFGLFSGSILFASFFMATDPVSCGQTTDGGRVIFGLLFGLLTALIRSFGIWVEGVTFALLLANCCAPLIDIAMKNHKKAQKTKKTEAQRQ